MDEKYISTVGSGGIPMSDASGTAQTVLPGAPRSVFVTARTKF
jgi:iron complex outermembrane receptor protein